MATSDLVYLTISSTLALLAVAMVALGARSSSPVFAIFSRWVRWLLVAFFTAALINIYGWLERPFSVLFALGFGGWFLLETIGNWIVIDWHSRSQLPLFPSYRANEKRDDWPNDKAHIALRDWLRRERYTRRQALIASLGGELQVRSTIFENEARSIRLQVTFLPLRNGSLSLCLNCASQREDGVRLITDNSFLPFGGFYPETWQVERRPWRRGLASLLQRHAERMDAVGGPWQPWEIDPLVDLNRQQQILERVNVERGFLHSMENREEMGIMTWDGRYRVWQELWLLSYFGVARQS